jgi:hypothetical protein
LGLHAFDTMEQAIEGLRKCVEDPRRERAAAYDVAREYLAPDRVLPPMLDAIFAPRRAQPRDAGPRDLLPPSHPTRP